MKKTVIILSVFALIASSCGQSNTKNVSNIENAAKPQNILLDINKMKNKSFVIDCGSGCAMRYTAENITQNGTSIDVKFIIEMYIDTILDEEPDTANFIFIYNEKYELQNVECDGESVLEGSSPTNQESYRKFGEDLVKNYVMTDQNSHVRRSL